jgi:hypothetical protein
MLIEIDNTWTEKKIIYFYQYVHGLRTKSVQIFNILCYWDFKITYRFKENVDKLILFL